MQDDYSDETSPSTSVQSDWKVDDIEDLEDEVNVSEPSATELNLRSVMSQRDMETLTSWFPKSAQALACVLRTRAQRLGV
jgi:hypothetical protein